MVTQVTGSAFQSWPVCPDLETLELVWSPLDGKALAGLSRFPGLKELDLRAVDRNPDDALWNMRHLSQLKDLRFDTPDTSFTGDGLAGLSGLNQLKTIHFFHSRISKGFKHLVSCAGLRMLELSDTLVDDQGLAEISTLSQIDELYVYSPNVTDEGVWELGKLQGLRVLCCHGDVYKGSSHVTENSLAVLEDLPDLEHIAIEFPMTELGIQYLRNLKSPRLITVSKTLVAPDMIRKIVRMFEPGVVQVI